MDKQARADQAIQRLCNYLNLPKIIKTKDKPTNLFREVDLTSLRPRYPANSQQDAGEVLMVLLNDVKDELREE